MKLAGIPLIIHPPVFRNHESTLGEEVGWRQLRAAGAMSGLGFGVGEIWALATLVMMIAPLQGFYPLFFYQGFIIERFQIVFVHGLLGMISYRGYKLWLPISYLASVGLHTAVNAPILIMQLGLIGIFHVSLFITCFSAMALIVLAVALTTPERRKRRRSRLKAGN